MPSCTVQHKLTGVPHALDTAANRQQAGKRSQHFVAASSCWTTVLLLLVVILLSGVSTPASAQAVRPSTFITSTRPAPTTAPSAARRPGGDGGPSGRADPPQNTAQRAGGVQQASTASTVNSARQASSAAAALQTDAPLVPSNSSSAMAPVTTEAAVTGSAALDTRLDAAFGILGASLVLSGLVLATAGAAYKRLTCFIVTSYAMAIVTMALILHFGIEKQIDPPRSGIRVAFVVASLAGGTVCGLAAAIFHRSAKIVIAPVAGFLFGLVIQSVRNDGLVRSIGPRYLLFLGIAGLAFILGLIPRYFDAVLLISTAFLGALAFSLGIDCFTTAGLKEFFIMNLGFTGIFPQLEGHFSISSIMQIELGLIALIFCISIAIQIRFFNLFEKRLARLFAKTEESEKRKREEEEAANRINIVMNGDVEKFEHRYSRRFPFAIPSTLPTLPTLPTQAHFDSKASSPSLGSQTTSFNTPKSESTPFLPELTYVTTGAKKTAAGRTGDIAQAMKTSESNKSFFSQMKSFMHTTSDTPPVPSLKTIETEKSEDVLAKEIAEREEALEKIKTIRQSIDNMRTHLRTHSEEESSLTSIPTVTTNSGPSGSASPPIDTAKPQNHRHSVSFGSIVGAVPPPPRRASASFTAPRPISQDSVITTQQHIRPSAPPLQGHTRSASQQTFTSIQRPTSTYSNWAIGQEDSNSAAAMQHRRQSTMTIDTGRTSITQGEIRHSQRVARNSTAPQRVVTGIMPARVPTEQTKAAAPQRHSMVRTQTMDILDLHAKHRRRLSELQNGIPSTSAAPTSVAMTTSASQPTLKAAEPVRKRSSTVTSLSTIQSASLPTDLKKLKRASDTPAMGIDELGRRPSPNQFKNGLTPSPTMPTGIGGTSRSPTLSRLPTHVNKPVKTSPTLDAAALEAAKDSEADWLSY